MHCFVFVQKKTQQNFVTFSGNVLRQNPTKKLFVVLPKIVDAETPNFMLHFTFEKPPEEIFGLFSF